MVELGEAIKSYLGASSGVTEISSDRIFPVTIPQIAPLPAITYTLFNGQRVHAMVKDPGLTNPRVQVSTWSTDYATLDSLSKQVRLRLQDFTGEMATGVDIQRVFFEDEIDLDDQDPQTVKVTYHRAQDYIFWWST